VRAQIRAEESRSRALALAHSGQFYFAKRDGFWKFHPVSIWSLNELMNYAKANEIPLNPLYGQGLDRVGYMPCTGFITWREQLSRTRPRYFKWLNREYQKSKGEPTLWEYSECPREPFLGDDQDE